MSTKASVILTTKSEKQFNLYHNYDGYPEYLGQMLSSFLQASSYMPDSDKSILDLIKMEKGFEFWELDEVNSGIDYLYFLNLNNETLSYTEPYALFQPARDVYYSTKNEDAEYEKELEIWEKLLKKNKGEIVYFEL